MNNPMNEILSYCNNIKLLYVEDNEEARQFTMELLSRFFKNINVCENGEEALELFKAKDISLIMSDINMPKMNGIEMSKNIRDLNSDVPIILLSAHNECSFKDSANHAGVTDYLEKPLKLSKLIELLTSFANDKIGDN
ncbi:response regulator [Sulfurimonas sp.]|uniref:response regulator n=1 Tax=Sulfurimonas sp. TaxID=2022749 RepID=UPI003569EA3D